MKNETQIPDRDTFVITDSTLGKYRIFIDGKSYTPQKLVKDKSGYTWKACGYFTTLEGAARWIVRRITRKELRGQEVSLETYIKRYRKISAEVVDIIRPLLQLPV